MRLNEAWDTESLRMNRKKYFWKLPSTELAMGERTLIMGVLNVTPDSFSDGGRFSDPDRACARALEMEEQGADVIDLGAESTRPDSKRVSAEEEWRRLLPVLKLLRDKLTVPLSLDTYKSEIAERAVQYGVSIFNDPSGLTFDANLAKVAAEHNAGLILNHMRGTPETWGKQPAMSDVMAAVSRDLEATASRARRAGVEKNRIMVDPGLGFGKRKEQNSELIAHLGRLAELGYPILAGPSRKSFLNAAAAGNLGETETAFATAAAVTAAILYGAHMVRVHDVKDMRSAAQVADEILRVAEVHRAAAELAVEEQKRPVVRPRMGVSAPFLTGERAIPPRPPLAVKEVAAASEAEVQDAAVVQKPAPPEPVKDETPPKPVELPKPVDRVSERPVFRRPAADRPPRRESGDRPAKREFRPAAGRSDGDRPRADRPPGPGTNDRRPTRSFKDGPPRSAGRPAGDDRRQPRPGGDRPPRKFGGRPPQPGSGDRPREFKPRGDRPTGGDRPPRSGPPRGGSGPGRPPGGKPPRPFRKRP